MVNHTVLEIQENIVENVRAPHYPDPPLTAVSPPHL